MIKRRHWCPFDCGKRVMWCPKRWRLVCGVCGKSWRDLDSLRGLKKPHWKEVD